VTQPARSTHTRLALYEREAAWAEQIARAASDRLPRVFELADLRQIARMALWQACLGYDSAREGTLRDAGSHWRAYAYPRIHGAVMMSVRRHRWREATDWVALPAGGSAPAVSPAQECEAARAQLSLLLAGAVERLPLHERTIVDRYFVRGWSIAAIARQYHTSAATVYRLRRRALVILRRELGELGIHGSVAVWG